MFFLLDDATWDTFRRICSCCHPRMCSTHMCMLCKQRDRECACGEIERKRNACFISLWASNMYSQLHASRCLQ